ncbi:hypothetical protein AMTRI_Chr07g26390 [Amborella trichopoda]
MQPPVLFFLLVAFCLAVTEASGQEEEVLLAVKAHLIDPLHKLTDWGSPNRTHCRWTGVRCGSDGSVVGLDLSNMSLSGRVSDELQWVPNLSFFNICCNAFTTPLPPSLSKLTSLQDLDLSQNLFSGRFPSGLDAAVGLLSINASGNNFTGRLPEELGNLTKLENLDLRGSFFEGEIPKSFGNLKKLRFLGLSGNNLTGPIPVELGQLSNLETMIIGYNAFESSIPQEFGNLVNLQYLDLSFGSLIGLIPMQLGQLKKLNTMFLYQNHLEGPIPVEFGNLTALVYLDLSANSLNGTLPEELSQLEKLQLLNLMCNQLSGSMPEKIGKLAAIQVLELWNNSFTGPLPSDLGQHSPLQWLDVSSNLFSGEIPTGLCNGGNLTKLILFNNGFSGLIPQSIAKCTSLIRMRAHNNNLSGPIPSGLGTLPRLQRLELAGNNLTGGIPADLAPSTSLSFIDLSRNHLQYSLPSSILAIPNLQSFLAAANNLTGQIPTQLQDCPALSVLDLSSNSLSGTIPAGLGTCAKLVKLNLMGNQLSGEIPPELAMMADLAILDLSGNALSGAIPPEFGSSAALEAFNVSYNRLTGPVPTDGMLRTLNPNDLAGNPGLCGGVLAPCAASQLVGTMHGRGRLRHVIVGWAMGMSAFCIIVLASLGARWAHRRCVEQGCGGGLESRGEWPWRLTVFQRLNFTSAEILACIKESNVIGMGATGIVYRAEAQHARAVVAVKKLWRMEPEDAEGETLLGEVELMGKLRHRNILRLLGYMHNDVSTMLVYEYMPNGSLGEALHGAQAGSVLAEGGSRYNVAVGVAHGLCYLHHDCRPPVIHRDVKSNNILLDANVEPRVADFGLARMMLRKNETVSMVAGSYGYIAPEYGYTLKVDEKIDIYSFGVVLLELLTGRRPLDPEFGEGINIVEWVRAKLRNNRGVEEALDPNVGGLCKHVQEEMLLVLRIALLCTAKCPKDRPSMRDVLTMLGEAKPRRKSSVNKEKPIFSPPPVSILL